MIKIARLSCIERVYRALDNCNLSNSDFTAWVGSFISARLWQSCEYSLLSFLGIIKDLLV